MKRGAEVDLGAVEEEEGTRVDEEGMMVDEEGTMGDEEGMMVDEVASEEVVVGTVVGSLEDSVLLLEQGQASEEEDLEENKAWEASEVEGEVAEEGVEDLEEATEERQAMGEVQTEGLVEATTEVALPGVGEGSDVSPWRLTLSSALQFP